MAPADVSSGLSPPETFSSTNSDKPGFFSIPMELISAVDLLSLAVSNAVVLIVMTFLSVELSTVAIALPAYIGL